MLATTSANTSTSASGEQGSGGASGSATSSSGTGGATAPCQPIPNASYASLGTAGPPNAAPPPPQHPDLSVEVRGWVSAGGVLGLVDYGGDTDVAAPKLSTLFADGHLPSIAENLAVNGWDWSANQPTGPITDWEVTMIGIATTPGEVLVLPSSGYDIGGGEQARVLFVDDDAITLKYTLEDNVVYGYTIHIVGICVEPSLAALYAANDAAGRTSMPALGGGDPIGRAIGSKVNVAIRDTGAFMDPRSKKDWW